MRVVAPEGHRIPDRPPLLLSPGDTVEVRRRHDVWPAFVYVLAPGGEGWVPSRHLSAGSGAARALTGYDTTELALAPGERATVVARDDESGWWWCRTDAGSEGWVPADSLRAVGARP